MSKEELRQQQQTVFSAGLGERWGGKHECHRHICAGFFSCNLHLIYGETPSMRWIHKKILVIAMLHCCRPNWLVMLSPSSQWHVRLACEHKNSSKRLRLCVSCLTDEFLMKIRSHPLHQCIKIKKTKKFFPLVTSIFLFTCLKMCLG